MTANQINFARHKEEVRHNRVTEAEMGRHNKATESVGWAGVSATYAGIAETARHNQVMEDQGWYTAKGQVSLWGNQGEAVLMQAFAAQQNADSNTMNALTNQDNARTNALNAQTRISELGEQMRHNIAFEGIQQQIIDETVRHNKATEAQGISREIRGWGTDVSSEMRNWFNVLR